VEGCKISDWCKSINARDLLYTGAKGTEFH